MAVNLMSSGAGAASSAGSIAVPTTGAFVVVFASNFNTGGSAIGAATFNSTTMTKYASFIAEQGAGNYNQVALFGIFTGSTGTLSYSVAMGGNQGVSAAAFSNVNSTTPTNSTVTGGSTVGSSAGSLTISSGASSRAAAIVAISRDPDERYTPGTGETELADFSGGVHDNHWAAFSTASSAAGYALSWTKVSAAIFAHAAMELIESTSPAAARQPHIIFMQ